MNPPPITGYRALTESEIDTINALKAKAEEVRELVERLGALGHHDARWLSIGTTHLQQGFMALTRAVAKPTTF